MNTAELSSMSKQVRRDIINMTANAGSGLSLIHISEPTRPY